MARPPYVSIHIRSPKGSDRRVGARDIVDSIAGEIEAGRLAQGLRLPPVRVLELQLGISKNTVQAAYDELVARGLLESRIREGVFVASSNAPYTDITPIGATPAAFLPTPVARATSTKPDIIQLSAVFIDPDLLPIDKLNECFRSVLNSPGLKPFYDPQGYAPLRELIASRLNARGMEAQPDDIIVTTGSQQGIDIVTRALKRKHIATENPVYSHAKSLFESFGAKLTGLTLSPFEPVDLDAWANTLKTDEVSLLYAITSYQNPTGHSYSTYELVQLLELSQHLGFALMEDDWGSDMLSGSEYRPTLRALGGSNVLYLNSFTKKLLPSLRLGFLVGNAENRETLIANKRVATLANTSITEVALHEFLDRGYYDTHLQKLQAALDIRYHAALDAAREILPEYVRFSFPGGGPTLWLEFPKDIDLHWLRSSMLAKGVLFENSESHFYGKPHLHGFRMGYAFLPEKTLREALSRLAESLAELAPAAS